RFPLTPALSLRRGRSFIALAEESRMADSILRGADLHSIWQIGIRFDAFQLNRFEFTSAWGLHPIAGRRGMTCHQQSFQGLLKSKRWNAVLKFMNAKSSLNRSLFFASLIAALLQATGCHSTHPAHAHAATSPSYVTLQGTPPTKESQAAMTPQQ